MRDHSRASFVCGLFGLLILAWASAASALGIVTFASDATWQAASANADGSVLGTTGSAECYQVPVAFDPAQFAGGCVVWLPGWTAASSSNLEAAVFTKDIFVPGQPVSGTLWLAVDDWAQVSVNGAIIGTVGSTTEPQTARDAQAPPRALDLSAALVPGQNTIRVWVKNGPGAFAGGCEPCLWSQNGVWVYFGGSITYQAQSDASCSGANAAAGKPATASNAEAWNPPGNALDGDIHSGWNSGGFAPQWFEVDLGADVPVTCMRLLPDQRPDGSVTHQVVGRTTSGQEVLLARYEGFAAGGQWLELASETAVPVRYVRIATSASPSWIAWFEVELFVHQPTSGSRTTWGRVKALHR